MRKNAIMQASLIWRFKAKAFLGSVFYHLRNNYYLFISQFIDLFPLWEILLDQTIGISVEALLP